MTLIRADTGGIYNPPNRSEQPTQYAQPLRLGSDGRFDQPTQKVQRCALGAAGVGLGSVGRMNVHAAGVTATMRASVRLGLSAMAGTRAFPGVERRGR